MGLNEDTNRGRKIVAAVSNPARPDHHKFDILHPPGTALLAKQVHNVRGKLAAGLFVLLQLLVVDLTDLRQLGPVVRVFDGVVLARQVRLGHEVCFLFCFWWGKGDWKGKYG